MAKNYFYTSVSDPDIAKEIVGGCGKVYIQKHEYEGNAVMNYNAGGTSYLLLADSDAGSNDDYNSSVADNLYIVDDNSLLARGKVIDTFADTGGTEVSFNANAMVLVSDGVTAPTFTDGTTYTVQVLSGSNTNLFGDFFGEMNDSLELDNSIETSPLEICTEEGTIVELAEKPTRRMATITGATFNVPNEDVQSKVLNLEQYGNNSTAGRYEYHGGSAPDIQKYYQITLKTVDWDSKNIALQLFKAQLINNGALVWGGTDWKVVPWQAKGKRDVIRDSYAVDMTKIIRGF